MRDLPGPGRASFRPSTFVFPLPSWPRSGQPSFFPRRNSADSVEGHHWCVTRVCGTPKTAHRGPPRGLMKKNVSTLGNVSECLVENKIAPSAPQSCQAGCLYPGECGGMSRATSRPGPGPGQPVSEFLPSCFRYLPGSYRANHLSFRALTARILWRDSRRAHLVCHTCM